MSHLHSIYRKLAMKNPTKGVDLVVKLSVARENGLLKQSNWK